MPSCLLVLEILGIREIGGRGLPNFPETLVSLPCPKGLGTHKAGDGLHPVWDFENANNAIFTAASLTRGECSR